MPTDIVFGFGVIALLLAWRFVLTPSLVDHYRDKLFDLRDKVRLNFIENSSLDDPMYRRLRDLINGHILFLDKVSIFRVTYLLVWTRSQPAVWSEAREVFDMHFHSRDKAVAEYCDNARSQASKIVLEFASEASFIISLIALLLSPLIALSRLGSKFAKDGVNFVVEIPRPEIARVITVALSMFGLLGTNRPSIEDVLERAATENVKFTRAKFGTQS